MPRLPCSSLTRPKNPVQLFLKVMNELTSRYGHILIPSAIIALAVIFCSAVWPLLYHMLEYWKIIPEPETFSAIYLNESTALPHSLRAGQSVPFSFTIENDEGIAKSYDYRVYAETSAGRGSMIASGTLALEAGSSQSVAETYTADQSFRPGQTATIAVEVPTTNESIRFNLPNRE